MEYPAACEGLYDVFSNGALPAGAGGVGLAGRLNQETGKLEALPDELLARGFGDFDLVLIESDGSRGLPLKGWADHEPVIPVFTSCTVGILPLWPLGKPVSEVLVHRLPLFCALTGAKEGDILRPGHLIRLIRGGLGGEGGGRGLFAAARGGKILFLNQVEDRAALEEARELAALLPRCPQGPRRIIAGSVRLDQAVEL
jgi:probable selenium-dependent hydroxylase accessory protein YqeC